MEYTGEQLDIIAKQFQIPEGKFTIRPFGNGHINGTYVLDYEEDKAGEKRRILQRINTTVFPHPRELMENILRVTAFLKAKIISGGGDPRRETLNLVPLKGHPQTEDPSDFRGCFRIFRWNSCTNRSMIFTTPGFGMPR